MKKEWKKAIIQELEIQATAQNPTEDPYHYDGIIYAEDGITELYYIQGEGKASGNHRYLDCQTQ